MYDTILVATDGSEAATRAVEHAIDLATTFDASLHAIYVVDTRRYGRAVLSDSDDLLDELETRGHDVLDDITSGADIDVSTIVRRGRPHEVIDAYAGEIDADIVILGNRGLGAGREGQIGSVAERVVRYVDRPVMTA